MAWNWGTAGAGAGTGAMIGNMIVPGLGAVGGGLLGGLAGLFGQDDENQQIQYSDPYAVERKQLMAQLGNVVNQGFPEMQQWGQNYYNQQLLPEIREQYETKRNPYGGGFADTPEAMQFAKGAQGVTSDVATANMNARMQAMQMLGSLIGQPQAYTQAQTQDTLLPALLTGGLGLAGSMFGANQSTKAMKDLMALYGIGGITGQGGSNQNPYESFYNPGDLTNSLMYLGGQP
ncbi:MAG: hypothetical protein V1709_04325 [Planctomycetota bacterium]